MAPVGSAGFRSWEGEGEGGADLQRVRQDWPLGSRLLDILPPCQESLHFIAMVWSMAPVGSAGFRSWDGEGEGGANL